MRSIHGRRGVVVGVAMALVAAAATLASAEQRAGQGQARTISGAGATFPYPVYAKWASVYAQKTGTQLNYQSIGSGGGIKQIAQGTVDFGASDAPLEAAELDKMDVVQFPTVMGAWSRS